MENFSEFLVQNLNSLQENNGENFRQILGSFLQQTTTDTRFFKAPMDIIEDNENYIIYIDIPGVDPNSIQIDFFNNKIEINGERIKPYSDHIKKEIIYGQFKRNIQLPIAVTHKETVSVSASNGVLKININKIVEEKNKFTVRIN